MGLPGYLVLLSAFSSAFGLLTLIPHEPLRFYSRTIYFVLHHINDLKLTINMSSILKTHFATPKGRKYINQ